MDRPLHLSPPLPTVAVVVPSEDEVKPLADALNRVLPEQNLRAVACVGGRFVGEDNEICVFDVRHINLHCPDEFGFSGTLLSNLL